MSTPPIFEPEKLSMEGLFALADALRTLSDVTAGLASQPRFCDGKKLPIHGDMLQRFGEFINDARGMIHEEAIRRAPATDAERRRKVSFVADEFVDGFVDPQDALCGLTRELSALIDGGQP